MSDTFPTLVLDPAKRQFAFQLAADLPLLSVEASACANPECCVTHLGVTAMDAPAAAKLLALDDNAPDEGVVAAVSEHSHYLLAGVDLATGVLVEHAEAIPGDVARSLAAAFDGALLDELFSWMTADEGGTALVARPIDYLARIWRPGVKVAFEECFVARMDAYEVSGNEYATLEFYCVTPACVCAEVVLSISDLNHKGVAPPLAEVTINTATGEADVFGGRKPALGRAVWQQRRKRYPGPARYAAHQAALADVGARLAAREVRPLVTPRGPRPSRNAPCPCGSGGKYKKCCEGKPLPPA